MRVLVTGATGFLGGALVRRLVHDRVAVVATGRNVAALEALPLTERDRFAWDLASPADGALQEVLGGVTTIVHCAALSSAWGPAADFRRANVHGTRHCLDLAKRLGVEHFVHLSTPAVYFRFQDQIGVTEDQALPEPVNAYARTKALAEACVRQGAVPWTIIRPRGIYGAGDTALLPRLLRAARAGPLPRLRGGIARTDLTHVEDVVDAIVATLAAGRDAAGMVFNVSGGEALPIETIVERACAANGVDARWRDLPIGPTLAAVRTNEWIARLCGRRTEPRITAYGLGVFAYSQTLDISKARAVLGWTPRITFAEGLTRTFGRGGGA